MATLEMRLAFVLYILASVTHLGTGRSLCAHIGGAGVATDGLLGVTISSRRLQADAASWLQNIQQQHRQLKSPITCSLHACSTKETSLACQMQPVTELDPLQTGTLLLEPAMLLQHKQPPTATAEGSSSSPQGSQAANSTRPSAASALPTSVPITAAPSDSVTVKLAASCRLDSSSSKPQQANHTDSDGVLQDLHSLVNTTADVNTTRTTQQQQAVQESNEVWTEPIQLTFLQQNPPASAAAQSCPEGSAATPVWLLPDSLALVGSGLPHSSSQGSSNKNDAAAQDQQQVAGEPHRGPTWDASAGPYDDQYEYDQWIEESDDENGLAGSSHALVLLDLLLPDVEHWFVSMSDSTSNSSRLAPISLYQPGTSDGAGSAILAAAAVDVAAASSPMNVVWLWLGRLLLGGALTAVQLVWHHLNNKHD